MTDCPDGKLTPTSFMTASVSKNNDKVSLKFFKSLSWHKGSTQYR